MCLQSNVPGSCPAFSAPSTPLVKSESSFPPATTFTGLPSPHGCQTLKGYICGVVGGCALQPIHDVLIFSQNLNLNFNLLIS